MFANIGVYEPCGIFTKSHFILIGLTIVGIIIALKKTIKKSKEEIYKIIKKVTISICGLEIVRIVFSLTQCTWRDVNEYLPLYYCSMLIYAGLLSSFAKNKLKRVGDVFLATGSIIGGIVFIIYPSTSLPMYPAFHFISIHSFIFHGTMVYLGILVNKTNYIEIEKNDIIYFASFVGVMCVISLIVNSIFDSNLMFISKNFPGTPISILYKITNGSAMFNIIMILAQMTLPFYISYYGIKKFRALSVKKLELEKC